METGIAYPDSRQQAGSSRDRLIVAAGNTAFCDGGSICPGKNSEAIQTKAFLHVFCLEWMFIPHKPNLDILIQLGKPANRTVPIRENAAIQVHS